MLESYLLFYDVFFNFSYAINCYFLTVCSYHVTYTFQSKSTPQSFLNVKELLAQKRHYIWSLSDCNGARTHNHLVCKRTLNHLPKLAIGFKQDFVCVCVYVHPPWRLRLSGVGSPGYRSTMLCWRRFFPLPSSFIDTSVWITKPF